MNRIDKLYGDVIKHYEALVSLAAVENATDRNSTALAQYQMQVETTALTRAIEEGQSFTRQLQEMWLFGQLNTIGDSEAKQRSDETANELSALLQQLAHTQKADPDHETKMES
ncbi:hypothetical protein D0867_08040 [Hortaea werneckii]|uniref:Uncharacterized protein n=1 Tax=Hortaea werneckii TaxID=91943 RepID=A0A3M7AL53_HORWE|nr:hypothetical protein D0867_08040 [Hortaea werneckii]RMY28315.1 hypothetical protein D0866_09505 [Hortaea werneckii]